MKTVTLFGGGSRRPPTKAPGWLNRQIEEESKYVVCQYCGVTIEKQPDGLCPKCGGAHGNQTTKGKTK